MFIVLAYDVNQKRVGKVMKVCRKYLTRVQNSLFEGYITESKLDKLKNELAKIVDYDDDSICIYSTENKSNIAKEQLGVVINNSPII